MVNLITHINWIGVVLAFLAYFTLGALWFTLFFAKPYKISLGRENEKPEKPALIFIVGPAICSLVITITTAILMHALNIQTYASAFEFGVVVGLGYLVSNTVNIAINPNIPRPLFYGTISGAYHLAGIFIVSMILVAMR